MDIRNWGIGKKMLLPDYCFGRKFIISCSDNALGVGQGYDISELAFPEISVIWGLHIWAGEVASGDSSLRIALGDQLPANTAQFDTLEPLFAGLGGQGPGPRYIRVGPQNNIMISGLRKSVHTSGRKMCIEVTNGPGDLSSISVAIVVSSVPNEIVEWKN